MNKIGSFIDSKDSAMRERRRRMEEERRKRIFNPRARIIGIDVAGLNKQLDQKRQIESEDRRRDEAFDEDRIRNDKIAVLMADRIEQDKRGLDMAVNLFRQQYQRPEDRREFDLYDPMGLKKEMPARICDEDPRCTVSGLQKFEGEDLCKPERVAMQKQQFKNKIVEQNMLRRETEENLRTANEMYFKQLLDLDRRACNVMDAEAACRRAVQMAISNYNTAMTQQKERENILRKQQEIEDNYTEISNSIFGDLLSENPEASRSAFGPHRVIPDRWKGMTKEQVSKIRNKQLNQIKERQDIEQQEKIQDKLWDTHTLEMARTANLKEFELENQRRGIEKQIAQENMELAHQQRDLLEFLNNEVYRTKTEENFYDQFNTTVR